MYTWYVHVVCTYILPHNLSYLCHCYIYPMSLLNWLPSPYYAIKCEVSKNIGQPHFNPFVGWALKQALVMNRIFTHEYTSKVFNKILLRLFFSSVAVLRLQWWWCLRRELGIHVCPIFRFRLKIGIAYFKQFWSRFKIYHSGSNPAVKEF